MLGSHVSGGPPELVASSLTRTSTVTWDILPGHRLFGLWVVSLSIAGSNRFR